MKKFLIIFILLFAITLFANDAKQDDTPKQIETLAGYTLGDKFENLKGVFGEKLKSGELT